MEAIKEFYENNKEYIRFGEIPKNERSGIYAGDAGKIGEEIGVSCYECVFLDGRYRILLPLNANIHVCATLGHLIDEYLGGGRKIFLITGKEIGKGKDNEPLLKNINILKEIELRK